MTQGKLAFASSVAFVLMQGRSEALDFPLNALDPTDFFSTAPCRVLDTRLPDGPYGGPALVAGADRAFPLSGVCGIPSDATAVSVNIAVTGATSAGNLRLHAGGTAVPLVATINFSAGQTRSNNAVVGLSPTGELAAFVGGPAGTVHVILDVNGYFAAGGTPPAVGSIVVNEFQTAGANGPNDEFVELRNPSGSAVYIGGCQLVYRSSASQTDTLLGTVPEGTSPPTGGYYVFGGSGFSGASNQTFTSALAGTGGGIGFRGRFAVLLDSVGYGSVTTIFVETMPAPAPPSGQSAGRDLDGADTNNNFADFFTSAFTTPGAPNTPHP